MTDDRKLKNAPKQNFSRSILPFSGVHRTLGLLWHQQVVWFHYRQFTQSCQPVSSLLTVSPKRWQFHSYLFFMLLLEGSCVNHRDNFLQPFWNTANIVKLKWLSKEWICIDVFAKFLIENLNLLFTKDASKYKNERWPNIYFQTLKN